jgi:two-component system sensor histidine kinase KdpD
MRSSRAPDVVLVDELAHTTPPGSARPKRYLDVAVLCRHGIDVISTVNVQHLESMNEVVASITGIGVRETIPDCVLDEADEVLLVDLPVGALLARLEAGKVYPGSRADQALTGFFKEGNLTALRELALRRTAEGVDERLADLMLEHGDALIAASDRILVLASADRRWGGVLRTAWRLASALRGDLLVVVPAPNASLDLLPANERTAVEANLRLAEDLGAEVMLLPDEGDSRHDLVDEMARLVRRERVSMLVVGIDPHPKRGMFRRGNRSVYDLVESLVERVDALDTHLVGYEDREPE